MSTAYQLVQNYPLNILHPVFEKFTEGKCVAFNSFDTINSSVFKDYFIRRGVASAILCPIIIQRQGKSILDGMVVAEFADSKDGMNCVECVTALSTFTDKVQTFIDLNTSVRK